MPAQPADHPMPSRQRYRWLCALFLLMASHYVLADPQVRVAVLKFGTASWELSTVRHHGFDREEGIELRLLELAGKQATMVALQGGDADIALTDWFWVSRQRAAHRDFSFIPYSSAAGSLVVRRDSDIRSPRDLTGKRVGIAGGPLDKNWLLFRALAIRSGDADPSATVIPVFGAPPLLNSQIEQGRLDAVINFWPYVARLTAKGMRVLMSAQDAAGQLGLGTGLPLVGYVFDAGWARAEPRTIAGFIAAVTKARALLATSDTEWERLRPAMQAADQASFEALRDGYRSGIPKPMDEAMAANAARLFAVLAELGGEDLVGPGSVLSPGTFWGIADE